MYLFNILAVILGCVVLFLFAIQKFSRQMEYVAGKRLRKILQTFTSTSWRGIMSGTFVTALIQSSTATTVMLVGLVDSGLITFGSSVGVILGANIGTTVSSQLIAWNGLYLAPYILISGFLLHIIPNRFQKYSKAIMYFGLIFFSFLIISILIKPLQNDPVLLHWLSYIHNFWPALLAGICITALFQSSSVVTGLVILLVGGGLLNFDSALGIILGANIGTTITALIASAVLSLSAKRTAFFHLIFNLGGVIIILPFLKSFVDLVQFFDGEAVRQVANAHLIFNLVAAGVFSIFLKPITQLVTKIVK